MRRQSLAIVVHGGKTSRSPKYDFYSFLIGPFYFGIVGALFLRKGMEGVGSVLSARGLAMT